jgi:2-C-methyl-D-erythritol 4-phosphate cytidylyltransferase
MQTPQGARRELLLRALAEASRDGLVATDEVGALLHAGVEVALVPGDERNIKLTRPADWLLAEALWMRRES